MFERLITFIFYMTLSGAMFGITIKAALDALFQTKFFWFGMYLADAIFVATYIVRYALNV